jgi:hypothetical protein
MAVRNSQSAWLARAGVARVKRRGIVKQRRLIMPSSRKKLPDQPEYLKRRTFERGRAEVDAAHIATCRLYCDALHLWRRCAQPTCRRHRHCLGEPTSCFVRGLPTVPPARRLEAQKEVIAGGPRRIAPATHIEWTVRRSALKQIVSWGFG